MPRFDDMENLPLMRSTGQDSHAESIIRGKKESLFRSRRKPQGSRERKSMFIRRRRWRLQSHPKMGHASERQEPVTNRFLHVLYVIRHMIIPYLYLVEMRKRTRIFSYLRIWRIGIHISRKLVCETFCERCHPCLSRGRNRDRSRRHRVSCVFVRIRTACGVCLSFNAPQWELQPLYTLFFVLAKRENR